MEKENKPTVKQPLLTGYFHGKKAPKSIGAL